MDELSNQRVFCLISEEEDHWPYGYASLRLISKLKKHNLVRGLPIISFNDYLCEACVMRKHVKSSFKSKNGISTQST